MIRRLALVLVVIAPLAAQATILVPSQAPTIQNGINLAQSMDTVLVSAGTYNEVIDFGGKAISVVADQGPQATTIVGTGVGRVVTFATGESATSVLDGFTITGGDGGIACVDSSPTISGCVITGNDVTLGNDFGGGVHGTATPGQTCSPLFSDCQIISNFAGLGGGGVYFDVDVGATALPYFSGCLVSSNAALSSVPVGSGALLLRRLRGELCAGARRLQHLGQHGVLRRWTLLDGDGVTVAHPLPHPEQHRDSQPDVECAGRRAPVLPGNTVLGLVPPHRELLHLRRCDLRLHIRSSDHADELHGLRQPGRIRQWTVRLRIGKPVEHDQLDPVGKPGATTSSPSTERASLRATPTWRTPTTDLS